MPATPSSSSDSTAASGKSTVIQPWEDFDTILRHAERARAMNDKPRARTLYARMVELDPNDPRGWVGIAETAVSTDEAIISWAYTLALAPSSWEARLQMDSFIEERIAKSGITDAAVLLALARTLAEVGQKPSAYRLVTHATELDPTNIDAWLWRAGIAEDHSDSIRCLRHVLAIDPENEQAKAGLKWALAQQRTAIVSKSPAETAQAKELFEQGQSVFQTGTLTDAYELFVKATQLDPTNESAWFWRGSTAPNIDESLACMEQTLRINPHHSGAKDALWYLRVKKYRESFAIRTSPSLALDERIAEQTLVPELSITPPTPKPSLRLLFITALLVFLVLSVVIFFVTQR